MTAVTLASDVDYAENARELLEDALRLAGVLDIEASASDGVIEHARRALNKYLKYLQTKGSQRWRETEGVLFLDEDQQSYSIGPDGDQACAVSELVATNLSAAAALGATSLTVDSTAGMAEGDVIGIELTAGTRQWTTIATGGVVSPTALTISDALTGAASNDAQVVSYTNVIERPVRISNVRRRDASGTEVPVELVSRQEYMEQSLKSSSGKANTVYYSRQLDTGTLYVWPTADDVTDQLRFTYERTIHDVDTIDDALDIPQEAMEAVEYNIGLRLAIKYGKRDRIAILRPEAAQKEAELLGFDAEDTSVFFAPDRR